MGVEMTGDRRFAWYMGVLVAFLVLFAVTAFWQNQDRVRLLDCGDDSVVVVLQPDVQVCMSYDAVNWNAR